MVRALRIQYPGALYHVTNRGNERKSIFYNDDDRNQFINILTQSLDTYSISLHSFVLMPNHWHLLCETPLGNLGEFMRHFNITYTSYYNRHHNRIGHLYQGRYKSFLVEKDSYLSVVSRYIHLNPVRVETFKKMPLTNQLKYLWDYKWSSLPGYLYPNKRFEFLEYDFVLGEYGGDNRNGRIEYQKQIAEDLATGLSIRDQVIGGSILGGVGFVSWAQDTFLENKKDREIPVVGKVHSFVTTDLVVSILAKELDLKSVFSSSGVSRHIVMVMLYKYAGLNNREIGELFKVDYSTVSQARKRLRDRISNNNNELRELLNRIEQTLSRIKI